MELPAGPVQDYIRLAGICAIYVASSPSGVCRIGVSRDLKRTLTMLRRQDPELTCTAAFWVDNTRVAIRITSRVNKAGCGAFLTEIEARIAAIAEEMKVHLTDHAAVLQRVRAAVSHVAVTLEQAQKTGGLKWFNRAFRDFRLRAQACGHQPLNYTQARARLRRVIIARVLAGEHSRFGAEILPEVFPESPE
jgi:hypothetical protein